MTVDVTSVIPRLVPGIANGTHDRVVVQSGRARVRMMKTRLGNQPHSAQPSPIHAILPRRKHGAAA
jgi:hypothetical protein